MHVPKFTKNAVIEVRLQIKYPLAPTFDYDINAKIRQRLYSFYIPIHGGLTAEQFCMDFRH